MRGNAEKPCLVLQVASNTAARGQAAGGSSVSSTSQFDPVHSFNPTAVSTSGCCPLSQGHGNGVAWVGNGGRGGGVGIRYIGAPCANRTTLGMLQRHFVGSCLLSKACQSIC